MVRSAAALRRLDAWPPVAIRVANHRWTWLGRAGCVLRSLRATPNFIHFEIQLYQAVLENGGAIWPRIDSDGARTETPGRKRAARYQSCNPPIEVVRVRHGRLFFAINASRDNVIDVKQNALSNADGRRFAAISMIIGYGYARCRRGGRAVSAIARSNCRAIGRATLPIAITAGTSFETNDNRRAIVHVQGKTVELELVAQCEAHLPSPPGSDRCRRRLDRRSCFAIDRRASRADLAQIRSTTVLFHLNGVALIARAIMENSGAIAFASTRSSISCSGTCLASSPSYRCSIGKPRPAAIMQCRRLSRRMRRQAAAR